ncbi:MAG TPA: hypothetical protein VE522_02150 [Actinomycetota bacterium]|nr:hypothetical protein [Actinomycetota bacterium]
MVVERFESLAPDRWSGMSLSVLDERHGRRQTWVDSTGNYWAFRGSLHPEGFSFAVTEDEESRQVEKRMVFSAIEGDSFDWRWERSVDGGETWEPRSTIAERMFPDLREAARRRSRTAGRRPDEDPEQIANARRAFGLDRPVIVQYGRFA